MQIVALLLATDYEGESLLGVYSSQEAAESAAETFLSLRVPLARYESLVYRAIQLDGAAEYHW
jgi:hypothetical protein